MNSGLKKEIFLIIKALKASNKRHLAKEIEENWHKTCKTYSKEINTYKATLPLEKIMSLTLNKEFKRLGYTESQITKILKYLEKHRVLQTTPHISPAQKPRYFFINWLASLALKKTDFYLVAMFSGIPFSNKTRPGRLCSKTGDINLIPSNMQDALVYRSKIPQKMIEELQKLPANLKNIFPEAKLNESYTSWALKSSQKIENRFLKGKLIFFDFNEVVANYILLAIKDENHPVFKILFDSRNRAETIALFSSEVFFYGSKKGDKYESMEGFHLKNGYLESPSRKIILTKGNLKKEIEQGLCPGLPLGFLAFTFLNHFKCFGSFAQTEYLPMYKKDFMKIPCLKKAKIKDAPTENLTTTGGFPENSTLHPLDLYLNEKIKVRKDIILGEVIVAIKDVLIHQNYSTNMVK